MHQASRSIFFDLDGTLCDSLPGIAASIREVLPPDGEMTPARLRSIVGPPIRVMFSRLVPGVSEKALDELEANFRRAYDGGNWRNFAWYPGVEQTIENLHSRGYRIFLFTNKPKQAVQRMTESVAFGRYFEAIVTKDSKIPAYVSKTQMLRELILRYKVDTQNAVVVGDGEEDLQAARNLELPFVFAGYGYGNPAKKNGDRFQVIKNFRELIEICNRGL